MRAVHSVFEGAPASGEDFSNLSFRGLVNGQWSFKGASWCSKPEWWCLLDRVNGAATSWKPIWSSPARGLCPPRASLPHKVKPIFYFVFSLPNFFLAHLNMFSSGPTWGRLPEWSQKCSFWPEWRNFWGGLKDPPSWFINKWYDMLRLNQFTTLSKSCETIHCNVGWSLVASHWGINSIPECG